MKKIILFFFAPFFLISCGTQNTPQSTIQEVASPQDEMMREHCKVMPEMPGCEPYVTNTPDTSNKSLNDLILTEDATVTDVKPSEVVNLKDGDTYDITIQKVRKVINGKSFIMLSYNGSIPGPTFRAPKGATIKFQVRNTVKELETTIHPHGIRLNYIYDGIPRDQGGMQDPIQVGELYEQIVTFPDTGVFWYHPHTRDDFEQELGEYGAFQIYDPTEIQVTDTESVITLDDILIENGRIPAFQQGTVNHALMGRYGNTMFVNGETDLTLTLKQGEVRRLYLINTANARPFDFSITGVQMKLIGSDIGYYERESMVSHVAIAPAERYIVDIMSETAGEYTIETIGGGVSRTLGKLIVSSSDTSSPYITEFQTLGTHDILGDLSNKLSAYRSQAPDKQVNLTMTMAGMGNMGGMGHNMSSMMGEEEGHDGIEWEDTMSAMNTRSTTDSINWIVRDEATGKEGMDIDWTFTKGSLVKIRITNDKNSMHPMQHPFHMHGQRFLILDKNGITNTNLVWKDTVLVPRDEYVDILVDMSNPGTWMAHCHISEHIFAGMMFHYKVQ